MSNRELLNTYNPSLDMPSEKRVFITNNVPIINEKTDILYEQVGNVDFDIDYDFQLQTHSYNSLVELANPLLATALRLRKLSYLDDILGLYSRMQNEIAALSEKVKKLNYDSAFQLSFRYCVCTFIDEMVMATPWGNSSIWGQRSLLAHFHNETWGGEKFYSILSRTMLEPEKYHELLEFMYICLALGFKGQYALNPHGQENIQNILLKLQKTLRPLRGYDYQRKQQFHLYEKDYTIKKPLSLKHFVWSSLLVFAFVYFLYSMFLDSYSTDVISNINDIMNNM
ncbi:type IVB secretion system protein IcmH/DotU [Aggregatibacter actinomycetemcomitans]|uniref:type IVB secretion system protein IcmH/DotU n=1 Tax=Aggregatibacter actinomycetemcomitans TaxID=714 RepID=UPI00197C0B65|nr:type IVB secretion system protein IcmH/DotU [Aggregatibacter actinomycetemcomitans]MBN6063475.1 DotU family type IV/VI secretion system protein [Aggregatibacter actinomycetemcomitans]MBN6070011.1 DotU family type IV/VI secretion system protein [Aggregatibacter actinomycetemcomitans]MBN6082586.1 DotU family type IV/VI secretion system protein [Aggregatibacter actinomycetemcomitans]MBN6084548.1 DotU family type IV/VI secretion system protein [Aggregatibacter actinomycetemcomitans]